MKTDEKKLKPLQFWDECIKLYPSGVSRKRLAGRSEREGREMSPRGSITTFSRHSSLRLRRSLLELAPADPSQYVQLGLTITVPWDVTGFDDDRIAQDYKIAFNRFSTAFRRRFPNSLCIFRHELQKRRAPHSHFVLWLSRFDFDFVRRGRAATSGLFRALILCFWSKAVLGSDSSECFVYPCRRIKGFHRYGIKIDVLRDSLSMFRYIADHASKHKKLQLGYHGKQWGFINRRLFVPQKSFDVCFQCDNDFVCFFRHLSKLSRYTLDKGSDRQRLSKRSSNKSVIFVPDSVSVPLGDAVFAGDVCLVDDIPARVFVRQYFWLLWFLLDLVHIQYDFARILYGLTSRFFVISQLMPHILVYE